MKSIKKEFFVTNLLVICLLIAVSALGQYEIRRYTIDGGGGTSSGGDFVLVGTIGQHDAAYSSGGSYELFGGFWSVVPPCTVDFIHFARFAEHWRDMPCNQSNMWCGGADLNYENNVDLTDLSLFVEQWLNCCPMGWPLG